ncbi:interferon-induced very large GTPase 1-like [Pelodytes ibericus]
MSSTENTEAIQELSMKVKQSGLNPEYWLPVLQEKLGISNPHVLQYIQHDNCLILESSVRYPCEKVALKRLFNIPDGYFQLTESHTKQNDLFTEKKNPEKKLIKQIQKVSNITDKYTPTSDKPAFLSANVDNIPNKHTRSSKWNNLEDNLSDFKSTYNIEHDEPMDSSSEYENIYTNEDFFNLIKRLSLEKFYPQKMKTTDFHVISRYFMRPNQNFTENQVPLLFLQTLLTLDYHARYLHCKQETNPNLSNPIKRPDVTKPTHFNVESFLCDSDEEYEDIKSDTIHPIHPMDIQMAIFHCADDFTRQYIYTKLSFCQFAVPILVPNPNTKCVEYPLWSIQDIKKKWKSKTQESKKTNDKCITEAETPVVSFIRIGTSSSSKSQILNSLISKQKHDIFFHRHCKGSTRNCLLMNGVTEIAWYCPSGKDNDVFDDCIAFTNLRGDAREHEQQVWFLLKMSSVLVILLADAETKDEKCKQVLQQISVSGKPVLFISPDREQTQKKSGILKIGLKNRSESELIQEITTAITARLSISNSPCSLTQCANIARTKGFVVDEDKRQCKEGKEKVQTLMSLLKEKPLLTMKREFLPLQGDLWHKWCQKDKEMTRLKEKSNVSIEQQRSNIQSRKQAIRQDQLQRAFPLNDFMRSFLEIIQFDSEVSRLYCLQWLKIYLDTLSSETLSALNQQYHKLWTELQEEKKKGKNKDSIKDLESKLEKKSEDIADSSFGLEHILREVGQIYEAQETFPNKADYSLTLPDIAASLMVSGYPVELMDGDAAHVPLRWITAVLDKVTKKIGNKKVFVLSVLGIQSTGKSTLLNAMFGLQFAVSAGRCTRGAFMQLVKVDEKLRAELKCDFVLVIDTEGLRAIELTNKKTLNHDNELATFVIGLGNITLINIFGENPSDMQDILQITVQAFLRMKQVRLRPSCLFVHQNVGEITAKEKNMEGRRKLQENLDEMTLLAAQQENCDVTCFNEVIKFDVNTHTHYFAQLWEGDPPMAPPNPSYSQNVQNLKRAILEMCKKEPTNNILTISEFKTRVTDLWNALLNENFVFSFKNSLEIATYNKLEAAYGQWIWELRKHMLNVKDEISNLIQNDKIKHMERAHLSDRLQETYRTVLQSLCDFFSDEKDGEMLVQWRESTENRLTRVKDDLIEEIKKKADELITSKNNSKKINEMIGNWEDKLFIKSREMALTLKGQELNQVTLTESFNKLWNLWLREVANEIPPFDPPDIEKDLEYILLEHFNKLPDIIQLIQVSSGWVNFYDEFSKHISKTTKCFGLLFEYLSKDQFRLVKDVTHAIETSVMKYLEKKEEDKMDYQISYFHEILNLIKMEVDNLPGNFRFKPNYLLYVSLYFCRRVERRFVKISETFRQANNPLNYLQGKRNQFLQSFQLSCNGCKHIASLADFLRDRLQDSLQQAVYKKAIIDIANDMKSNYPAFNGNRSNLEFHLLKSLAEKEDFGSYMEYVKTPKTAFETFIKECFEQYNIRKRSIISDILKVHLSRFRILIQTTIEKSSAITKDSQGDVSSWLDTFCSDLGASLTLPHSDLKAVTYQNIKDIDFLKEAMTRALETVVKNLTQEFSIYNGMTNMKPKPYEILYDQLAGCWKQCPCCKAICTNTISGHKEDHSVQFHRPQGINGVKWYKTNDLVTDICSSLVASDCLLVLSEDNKIPYKQYRKAGPPYSEWSITPDLSALSYWKWVLCRFQSDIEKHYDRKFAGQGKIPSEWKCITKQEAISEVNGHITSLA